MAGRQSPFILRPPFPSFISVLFVIIVTISPREKVYRHFFFSQLSLAVHHLDKVTTSSVGLIVWRG